MAAIFESGDPRGKLFEFVVDELHRFTDLSKLSFY